MSKVAQAATSMISTFQTGALEVLEQTGNYHASHAVGKFQPPKRKIDQVENEQPMSNSIEADMFTRTFTLPKSSAVSSQLKPKCHTSTVGQPLGKKRTLDTETPSKKHQSAIAYKKTGILRQACEIVSLVLLNDSIIVASIEESLKSYVGSEWNNVPPRTVRSGKITK